MPWAAAITAAASIGGAVISSSANKDAAKTSADASLAGAQMQAAAIDKQIAAIKAGVSEAQGMYAKTQETAQPGISYLRNVIATPASLTPEQESERKRLVDQVTNSSQVAGSALRGSGRSFVDAMRTVEGDFTNQALAQNKARADAAASGFAAPYFNAAGQSAAATASGGTQVGSALANQGGALAKGATDSANTYANSTTANGKLWGSALGTIGAAINTANKTDSTGTTPSTVPAGTNNGIPIDQSLESKYQPTQLA